MKKFPLFLLAFLLLAVSASARTGFEVCQLDSKTQELLSSAYQLANSKRFAEAKAELSKAIALAPDAADLYLRRAEYSVELKQYEDLFKDVQTAITLKPFGINRILSIGYKINREKDSANVSRFSDILISSGELKYLGYEIRADYKFLIKDYAGAVEDYLQSFETAPYTFFPHTGRASSAVFMVKFNKDANFLNYQLRLLDWAEKRAEYYKNNNVTLTRIRQSDCTEETITLGERELDSFYGNRLSIIANTINIYESLGEKEKALELVKRMGEYPPFKVSLASRAQFYLKRNYFNEAIADLTTLIEMNETDVIAEVKLIIQRGDTYVKNTDYQKALADYLLALSVNKTPAREKEILEKIAAVKQKIEQEQARQK